MALADNKAKIQELLAGINALPEASASETKAEFKKFTLPTLSYNYTCIGYGGGKFIAFTHGEETMYSTDGVNWTQGALSIPVGANRFAYGNDVYMTASNAVIMRSTDGLVWTYVRPNNVTATWTEMCYGRGVFVAKREYQTLFCSTDGLTWTEVAQGTGDGPMAYGAGKFVEIYCDNGPLQGRYSYDGVNWTAFADNTIDTIDFEVMCYGGGKFVALAANYANAPEAVYSEDGLTWHKTTLPFKAWWSNVCYGNGMFVATCWESNRAIYSMDGINWTEITLPINGGTRDICYGDGKFIVINDTGTDCAICDMRTPLG